MKRLFLVLAGVCVFCGSLFAEDRVHVLKTGETIYGIAKVYGVKPEEILFINGIEDARKVKSGQSIKIPSAAPSSNSSSMVHRAQKGDTLFGIARRYGVNIKDIRAANSLSESYVLKIGDTIKIPAEASASKAPTAVASKTPTATKAPTPAAKTPVSAAKPTATPAAAVKTAPAVPDGAKVNLSLVWPVKPKEAAYMTGKLSGVVLAGERGEGVYCIYPGTVVSAGPHRGFGRVVIVKSAEGYLYVYGGCENLLVKAGDLVGAGMELGSLGLDAVSGKAALFFMVYQNNTAIDPAKAPRY
jgi:murein DD-endopeptidase MepM/ murein hydrolase activator NlpD